MYRLQKQRLLKPLAFVTAGFGATLLYITTFSPRVLAAAKDECTDNSPAGLKKCLKDNPIVKDLQIIVNFLSIGVAVVVVGVIIVGGIQYITAGDSAEKITAAKQRIMNGLIALFIFIFTFAFLQWLIPGGAFR